MHLIAQGASKSICQLVCMFQKLIWDFWCACTLKNWPWPHFWACRFSVPSKSLVWFEFWFLVPPGCWKSLRGPGEAFVHAVVCSKSIFGTFGVSSKFTFGALVRRDPHKHSHLASFDFECLQVAENRSGAMKSICPRKFMLQTHN